MNSNDNLKSDGSSGTTHEESVGKPFQSLRRVKLKRAIDDEKGEPLIVIGDRSIIKDSFLSLKDVERQHYVKPTTFTINSFFNGSRMLVVFGKTFPAESLAYRLVMSQENDEQSLNEMVSILGQDTVHSTLIEDAIPRNIKVTLQERLKLFDSNSIFNLVSKAFPTASNAVLLTFVELYYHYFSALGLVIPANEIVSYSTDTTLFPTLDDLSKHYMASLITGALGTHVTSVITPLAAKDHIQVRTLVDFILGRFKELMRVIHSIMYDLRKFKTTMAALRMFVQNHPDKMRDYPIIAHDQNLASMASDATLRELALASTYPLQMFDATYMQATFADVKNRLLASLSLVSHSFETFKDFYTKAVVFATNRDYGVGVIIGRNIFVNSSVQVTDFVEKGSKTDTFNQFPDIQLESVLNSIMPNQMIEQMAAPQFIANWADIASYNDVPPFEQYFATYGDFSDFEGHLLALACSDLTYVFKDSQGHVLGYSYQLNDNVGVSSGPGTFIGTLYSTTDFADLLLRYGYVLHSQLSGGSSMEVGVKYFNPAGTQIPKVVRSSILHIPSADYKERFRRLGFSWGTQIPSRKKGMIPLTLDVVRMLNLSQYEADARITNNQPLLDLVDGAFETLISLYEVSGATYDSITRSYTVIADDAVSRASRKAVALKVVEWLRVQADNRSILELVEQTLWQIRDGMVDTSSKVALRHFFRANEVINSVTTVVIMYWWLQLGLIRKTTPDRLIALLIETNVDIMHMDSALMKKFAARM